MTNPSRFQQFLGLHHPIIQAPMAGGGDTDALITAVGKAGALGFMGAAYLTTDQLLARSSALRAASDRPFGINLFAPQPQPTVSDTSAALALVAPAFHEVGLTAPDQPPAPLPDPFDQQFQAVLDSGCRAFSLTMGLPPAGVVEAARARNVMVLGTATTVSEAVLLQQAGVDGIIAQGAEAGGHRGTFAEHLAPNGEAPLIGTMALVPQIVDAVNLPVIASGGIMDGRGIAAALALGAVAVQMGTAFLVTREAGASPAHQQAILNARDDQTRITRAFSGRPARGVVNRFMTMVPEDGSILPFPLQNSLTRPLRTEAGKQGLADHLSLWSGQAPTLARPMAAGDLVAALVTETQAAIDRLHHAF